MPEYDLLIKNGRVIDPAQNLDAQFDIAIKDGRIVRLAPDTSTSLSAGLDPASASRVISASDKLICPGLIDLHAHPCESIVSFGLSPNDIGINAGVTTINDAGSAGYANFESFRRYVIAPSKTDIFAFLHLSPVGEVVLPEIGYEAIDKDAFRKTIESNRDLIKGIKIRVIAEVVNASVDVVGIARSLADELDLPIMVHIGTLANETVNEEMITAFTSRMLNQLKTGDIISHAFTHKIGAIFNREGNPLPELNEALTRGVKLDIASAHAHFSFQTARAAIAKGFRPFTLSTDLTTLTYKKADQLSLTLVMSEFMALGFSLVDVVRMTTLNPALVLREEHQRGSLREGMPADLTILDLREGKYTFSDVRAGNTIEGKVLLVPEMTVKDGLVYECNKE